MGAREDIIMEDLNGQVRWNLVDGLSLGLIFSSNFCRRAVLHRKHWSNTKVHFL